jgi:hypothetical protein
MMVTLGLADFLGCDMQHPPDTTRSLYQKKSFHNFITRRFHIANHRLMLWITDLSDSKSPTRKVLPRLAGKSSAACRNA